MKPITGQYVYSEEKIELILEYQEAISKGNDKNKTFEKRKQKLIGMAEKVSTEFHDKLANLFKAKVDEAKLEMKIEQPPK